MLSSTLRTGKAGMAACICISSHLLSKGYGRGLFVSVALVCLVIEHAAAGQVGAIVCNKFLRSLHEIPHALIADVVIDIFPAPLTRDKATMAQTLHMDGHTPLRGTSELYELAHIVLTLKQQQQEL